MQAQNPSPEIHQVFTLLPHEQQQRKQLELDNSVDDPFDELEIFQLIRHINDPEYPLTLEQLNVVKLSNVSFRKVDTSEFNKQGDLSFKKDPLEIVEVKFKPTIPHCSMAQMIGLMLKVKLLKFLPKQTKVHVKVEEGTHVNQHDINKQINDKERVAAALENNTIEKVVKRGFHGSDRFSFFDSL